MTVYAGVTTWFNVVQLGRMKSAQHLTTLDGLRGVAAIAVVFTHAGAFLAPVQAPGGSLAVDLFFMLSGYVLIHAYKTRLDNGLGPVDFMIARFIRLIPLYMLGAALGTLAFLVAHVQGTDGFGSRGVLAALVGVWTMLPSPIPNANGEVFAINGPRWSLFFELVANLLLVTIWRWPYRKGGLAIVLAISVPLFLSAVWQRGTMEFGWSNETFLLGFPRAIASFFVGVVLRLLAPPREQPGLVGHVLPLTIVPAFLFDLTGHPQVIAAVIFLFFPLLIIAGSRFAAPRTTINQLLGTVSYPLYILHVPVFEFARFLLRADGSTPSAFAPELGLLLLSGLLFVSWALAQWYDDPIRERWSRRLQTARLSKRHQ